MAIITVTGWDREYIGRAQAKGRMLLMAGAVEIVSGDWYARVKDIESGSTNYADSEGCDCSTRAQRNGHACSHMWGGYYALEEMASVAPAEAA